VVAAPVVVVLGFAEIHARFIGHYRLLGSSRSAWTALFVLFLELAVYVMGLPGTPRSAMGAVWSSVGAVLGAAGAVSVLQLLAGSPLLPRFVVLTSTLTLITVWSALTILYQRRLYRDGGDRVLAVVDPDEAATLDEDLHGGWERALTLVATIGPEEATPVGVGPSLVDRVTAERASVVVLGQKAQADEAVVAQAALLHGRGIRIRTLSLFYDEWLGKLPVSELERLSLMFDIQELHVPRYARLKRVVDVASALVGLALLAVVVPVVWVLDRLGNPGPLFFHQTRIGKSGREFTIVKFRSMPPGNSEGDWTTELDPRLSATGRWMRRVHLDELPQAVNVLRGELSLVGPRPEQPRYVAELTEKIPFYEIRHLVNPGITGWAQVKFPYGASVEDALEKLQYEFFYLRHQGPVLDSRILARTLRSVFGRHGR
jgi:lipopolysaccharide/colanic/teichoic acid biosynthesis glycosyltransferase